MSKEEIKYEINKVLDQFPDSVLEEVLSYLKQIDNTSDSSSIKYHLDKILLEDNELLDRLAK